MILYITLLQQDSELIVTHCCQKQLKDVIVLLGHYLASLAMPPLNLALYKLLPARRYARVIVIATCLSVHPSVRLSVTRWYCVKTKKASGMISSPSGSPKTLVF